MKVLVIGGGSMGGSILLRLSGPEYELSVFDRCPTTLDSLKERGIQSGTLESLLLGKDLTIIAVPMSAEIELLEKLEFAGPVMDLASVMKPFREIAQRRGIRFVSGHPVAGNEFAGPRGWDESMYEDRPFLLSPGASATREDLSKVLRVVNSLGARPEFVEPAEHDRVLSRISQSVYYLSRAAIVLGRGCEKYTGPGFASTTRLGRQNQEMVLDMAKFNGPNIANSLREAEEYLREVRVAIESGEYVRLDQIIREK